MSDSPDYYRRTYQSDQGTILLGEVTVKGITTAYGRVIMIDDFEGILNWLGSGDSGGSAALDQTYTFTKNYSLKIATATGGPDKDYRARRWIGERPTKKYRLEVAFRQGSPTDIQYVVFSLTVHRSEVKHQALIRYYWSADKWQYYDSTGTWQDITNGSQDLTHSAWNYLLFEVDFDELEFIRMECNELELDLSGISLQQEAATAQDTAYVTLEITSGSSLQSTCWFDEVLITAIP